MKSLRQTGSGKGPAETPSETGRKTGVVIPAKAETFWGHHYQVVLNRMHWRDAKKACAAQGGHLVIIQNNKENEFVSKLAGGREVWIGCTDDAKEGKWLWVDGSRVIYEHWNSGEPNNAGRENWGVMNGDGTWNDFRDEPREGYVCEWNK